MEVEEKGIRVYQLLKTIVDKAECRLAGELLHGREQRATFNSSLDCSSVVELDTST